MYRTTYLYSIIWSGYGSRTHCLQLMRLTFKPFHSPAILRCVTSSGGVIGVGNTYKHIYYIYSSLLGGHINHKINTTVITIGTNSTSNVLLLHPLVILVEMGGVEPPSWQQCHKVIHKFSWFLFLPTKSTFLNSFI